MAIRRRIGRRRVIDPGVVLLSASNLLSEVEYFPPSLELSDIRRYIVRVEAERRNLRRLHDSHVTEQGILNRIIQGLKEIKDSLELMKDQITSRRGHSTPRVYTGDKHCMAAIFEYREFRYIVILLYLATCLTCVCTVFVLITAPL